MNNICSVESSKYDNGYIYSLLWINIILIALVMGFVSESWTEGVLQFLSTLCFSSLFCYLAKKFNKRWLIYPILVLILPLFLISIIIIILSAKFDLPLISCTLSAYAFIINLFFLIHNFYKKQVNSKLKIFKTINYIFATICVLYIIFFGVMTYYSMLTSSWKSAIITIINPFTYLMVIFDILIEPLNLAIIAAGIANYLTGIFFEDEQN